MATISETIREGSEMITCSLHYSQTWLTQDEMLDKFDWLKNVPYGISYFIEKAHDNKWILERVRKNTAGTLEYKISAKGLKMVDELP
jgi:hypothetical protein